MSTTESIIREMNEFSLDEWKSLGKKGKRIVTRSGYHAEIQRTDVGGERPILALVFMEWGPVPVLYHADGKTLRGGDKSATDLMIPVRVRKVWANLYYDNLALQKLSSEIVGDIFPTRAEAEASAREGCIATIEVEIPA